jgi:hypothetical protein
MHEASIYIHLCQPQLTIYCQSELISIIYLKKNTLSFLDDPPLKTMFARMKDSFAKVHFIVSVNHKSGFV